MQDEVKDYFRPVNPDEIDDAGSSITERSSTSLSSPSSRTFSLRHDQKQPLRLRVRDRDRGDRDGGCCSALLAFVSLAWRPRSSSPRVRRHLLAVVLLTGAFLTMLMLMSSHSDSRSSHISDLWSSVGLPASYGPPPPALSYRPSPTHPAQALSTYVPPRTCPAHCIAKMSQASSDSSDSPDSGTSSTECLACVPPPLTEGVGFNATTHSDFIPAKIWQIFLDFEEAAVNNLVATWLSRSPSFTYTILDKAGAHDLVERAARLLSNSHMSLPVWQMTEGRTAEGTGHHFSERLTEEEIKAEEANKKKKETTKRQTMGSRPNGLMPASEFGSDIVAIYESMPRRVLKADFLRYLVLALEGGVYSDTDTALVRRIGEWVPEEFRNVTRLIVGIEADQEPPVGGTLYEVQFCQWTLSSAAHHPTMWTMVHRILNRLRNGRPIDGEAYNDDEVLSITGPAGWTEVVYEHLNQVAGDGIGAETITWKTLSGMREPRLFGDTLVLPIDGFATGVPHSNAKKGPNESTLILHQFRGGWRSGD